MIKRIIAWRYFPPLCLSIMWGAMVFLAYPVGEFPVNDTWSYSAPVKTLLETGILELSHWPEMPLIAHILWGYLVSLCCGFSYTILRCSIAGLGLVGLWGLYALLMEVGRDRRLAFLGTATLAVNPLYFHLACTFMTDIPFLTLAILSYLLLIKGTRKESRLVLAGGILLACVATLIRQVGLIIPVSFAIAYGFKHRLRWRSWVMGILAVAVVFGALGAYEYWLDITGKTPMNYRISDGIVLAKLQEGPHAWLAAADTAVACFVYLGLFLLPFLLWRFPKLKWRGVHIVPVILLLGWTLVVTAILMYQDRLMPLRMRGSLFYDCGLGPPALRDVFLLHRPHLPRAPEAVMILLTACGALGGGLLLKTIWQSGSKALTAWFGKRQETSQAWVSVMALSALILYLTPMAILLPFDRYLIFCVPLLLILLIRILPAPVISLGGMRGWLAAGWLIVFAVFAVGGTHDYYAWNRARWQAAHDLMNHYNIPPEKIDGGGEFNGLYCYDPSYSSDNTKSWWWVQDDQYILSFGPIRHYSEFMRYYYSRWIPPSAAWVYVQRRNDGSDKVTIPLATTQCHGGENRALLRYWSGDGRQAPVALSYGGYVTLEPGRYVATLHYMAKRPRRAYRQSWGQLRLVKFDNGPVIVEVEIDQIEKLSHPCRMQHVDFALEESLPVEVQIIGGDAQLWLCRVVFTKTG